MSETLGEMIEASGASQPGSSWDQVTGALRDKNVNRSTTINDYYSLFKEGLTPGKLIPDINTRRCCLTLRRTWKTIPIYTSHPF